MSVPLQGVVAMGWSCLFLSFLFVLLRLYVRWYLQARVALSDFFVILAWLCFVIVNAVSTYITTLEHWSLAGFDEFFKHPNKLYRFIQVNKGISLPYIISLYSIKASFLLFYLQLFPPSFIKLRFALYVTISLCIGCFLTSITIECLMCNPVDMALMAQGIPPRCKPWQYRLYKPAYLGGIAQDMVTDVLVYILPLFLLPTLQLQSKRKLIGLGITFSIGLLVVVCTITRLVSKKWIDRPTDVAFIISNTQLCAGIIVACLPPLKWLYHNVKYTKRNCVVPLPGQEGDIPSKISKRDEKGQSSTLDDEKFGSRSLDATPSSASPVVVQLRGDIHEPNRVGSGRSKNGWRTFKVASRTRGAGNNTVGSGTGRSIFSGLTITMWDPDDEEILARIEGPEANENPFP